MEKQDNGVKKSFYKKWWFWVLIVLVILVINSSGEKDSNQNPVKEEVADTVKVPLEYKSALSKANSYANSMHMSKAKVYDQLVSQYGEKFTAESAKYAIDNVKADWNANALLKAREYQKIMDMSPAKIHDQLTSSYGEKFTEEEADYAIQQLSK